jgi:hypothetical protein
VRSKRHEWIESGATFTPICKYQNQAAQLEQQNRYAKHQNVRYVIVLHLDRTDRLGKSDEAPSNKKGRRGKADNKQKNREEISFSCHNMKSPN